MQCPRCRAVLAGAVEQVPAGRVELDYCPQCRGVWFDASELAALLRLGNARAFAGDSPLLGPAGPALRSCPRCAGVSLCERVLLQQGGPGALPLRIDQCTDCEGVWLDGQELQQVAARLQERTPAFAADPAATTTGTGAWVFMALTGLPMEKWNPRQGRPLVVGALVAACVLAFCWQVAFGLDLSVRGFGLVPAELPGRGALPLFTHMFLHAGLLHLLGNLYFLWVFGDNVEDRLGHYRFLILYVLSGLAAATLYAVL